MTEERHARDANIFLTAEGLTTSPCMDKDPASEYSHDTQTPNSKVVPWERTIRSSCWGRLTILIWMIQDYFKKDGGGWGRKGGSLTGESLSKKMSSLISGKGQSSVWTPFFSQWLRSYMSTWGTQSPALGDRLCCELHSLHRRCWWSRDKEASVFKTVHYLLCN